LEPIPFGRLFLGLLLTFVLPLAAAWFPRAWWARALASQVGPDLNVKTQSRSDCLRGAAVFLILGTAAIAMGLATFTLAEKWYGAVDRVPAFAVLFFTYTILGLVGWGGAVYLVIRAPFRPAVMPVPVRIEVLKEYRSPDGTKVARVFAQEGYAAYGLLVPASPPHPDAPGSWQALGPYATLEQAEREALRLTGHLPRSGG
jgi:hypothetical protein